RISLRFQTVVLFLAAVILVARLYAYSQLDIEAYPNPVAPMVEIITQPPGWSAEAVERDVTLPLGTAGSGMIDLEHIRSQSLAGLSDVKCYFSWKPEYYQAQQRVLNRLATLTLPNGLQPQLSPWNAIGELFRYRLVGPGYSTRELKSAQDWILQKQWKQVPGVIDVVGFGGETKPSPVDLYPLPPPAPAAPP